MLDIVEVDIQASPATPTVQGFGTGLILSRQAPFDGIRTYNGTSGMNADFPDPESPTMLLATAYFSQNPAPSQLKVASITTAATWSARLDLVGAPAAPATGTVLSFSCHLWDGSERTATYTVQVGDTAALALAGLHAAIDALAGVASAYTVGDTFCVVSAQGSTRKLRVMGFSGVTYLDTEGNYTLATRLNALVLQDPDFYGVLIDSMSQVNVTAAAAWCLANKRWFIGATQDSRELGALSSVLLLGLVGTANGRCEVFVSKLGERRDGALMGLVLAQSWDNGTAPTHALRTLEGVSVDTFTPTEVSGILANRGMMYVRDRGANITWEGRTPNGRYGDLTLFLDWLDARISEAVFAELIRDPRCPYTSAGIERLVTAVHTVISAARDRGAVSPDYPLTVKGPKPAQVLTSERSDRILGGGGIKFGFVYAGAIHKVRVSGVVQ